MGPILRKSLRPVLLLGWLLLQSGRVGAEPHNGWWWNPNESGRGFFIEMASGVIYFGGYFFEADGRATWLTSGGGISDPYRYEGRLQRYRNGQTILGSYRAPDPAVDAGPIVLEFTSDTRGTITWPGGSIPIERLVFGTDATGFVPETGWWWNEVESGTGYSIEVQGSTAVVVAFVYDDLGDPVWYLSAGPMTTPTRYAGDWLQFTGGQTLDGPYRPPATPTKFGRVEIDFTAADQATLALSELSASGVAQKLLGRLQEIGRALPRRRIATRDHWPTWKGSVVWTGRQFVETLTQSIEQHFRDVVFERVQVDFDNAIYRLRANTVVDVRFHSEESNSGCTIDGEAVLPVARGELMLGGTAAYGGFLAGASGAPQVEMVEVVQRCPIPGFTPQTFHVPVVVQANFGHDNRYYWVRNFYACDEVHAHQPTMIGAETRAIPGGRYEVSWRLDAQHADPTRCP